MILPEVLNSQSRFGGVQTRQEEVIVKSRVNRKSGMTVNVLTTMVVTFVVAMAALLALAASSINQAIVGGVLAMAAGFINLLRRPPEEPGDCQ
jgi:hypothetical protein